MCLEVRREIIEAKGMDGSRIDDCLAFPKIKANVTGIIEMCTCINKRCSR